MARAMGKRRARKAPDGAEDDGAAIFRPVPGLREPGDLPMAHAMGYSLSLLRASIRSIYGIPVLLSRTRINERSCTLPSRRSESSRAPLGIGQAAFQPFHRLVAGQDHLPNAGARVDDVRLAAQVQENDPHFTAVS